MTKQLGMEVSFAAAEAVKLAGVDVIAAYPITPQTHIVERLSDYVANGELDAEFIPVESEHSALSVCLGSGRRARSLPAPAPRAWPDERNCYRPRCAAATGDDTRQPFPLRTSFHLERSQRCHVRRDTGWIQLFVENSQEVFDHVFIAYKIAEDQDVLLPVMLNLDGFTLSHMFEPVQMVDAGVIRQYLPPYSPKYTLHPDKPLTMGAFAGPEVYPEIKKAQDEALKASYPHILKAWDKWGKLSGRYYRPIEELHTGDAETLFLTMGSFGETAAEAVELMRSQGRKVGLLKLRLWRPFPFKELCRAVKGARKLIVLDRAVSYGGPGGPVAAEIRSALYNLGNKPQIYNYIVGLGGRDVDVRDYLQIYETAEQSSEYQIYGARE